MQPWHDIKARSPVQPVTVAERVSWEDFAVSRSMPPPCPASRPRSACRGVYPLGPDFAHIVGYVGPVSDYDLAKLDKPDPLLGIPRFQLGKVGFEARMEDDLRGSAGTQWVEVNSAGRVMRELDRQEGDCWQ